MKGTIKLLILIIGIVGLCNQSFSSYIDSANELANKGVIVNNASNPDAYRIYDKITRGEMAKITINLSGKSFSLGCSGIFSDLKSTDWACKYAESGNFYGFFASNTYFRPNDNITKIEALKMIMQARGIEKSSNSNWQKAYVEGALAKGILKASFSDYNTTAVRGWIFDIATEDIEEENDENTTPESCFEFDKTTGTITRFNCFALDIPERNYPDVVIPSKIGGVTVKSIGDGAFTRAGYFPKTESVVIPDTVTSIGDEAFYGNNLESVTIPDSVTYIGKEAFSYNNLEKIYIGKGVKTIGDWAFSYNNLSSVNIPNSVEIVGKGAFYWNPLSKVSKSDYSYIGESAFNNITPESCFEFDKNNYTITKYNCQFGSVVVPSKIGGNNVKFISNDVFYVDAIVPTGGYHSFGYRYIIIPDGVGYSGTNGKYYSQICSDSTLNKGGTVIGEICKDYTGNSSGDSEFCFEFDKTTGTIKSFLCFDNPDVIIPSKIGGVTVKAIGDLAFLGASYTPEVRSVVIPDTVTSIGDEAFYGNNLESVTIPDSVTYIGKEAFSNNKIKKVELGMNIETIGDFAFSNNSIEDLSIPVSIRNFGKGAFYWNPLPNYEDRTGVYGYKLSESCFEFDKTTQTITKYTCSSRNVIVPATIGGVTVKNISDDVFYVDAIMPDGGYRSYGYGYIIIPDGVKYSGTNGVSLSVACDSSKYNTNEVVSKLCSYRKDYTPDPNATPESCFKYYIVAIPSTGCSLYYCSPSTIYEEAKIDDYDSSCGENLVIPKYLSGVIVTTSNINDRGKNAFRNKGITSVTLPDNFTYMGEELFYGNNVHALNVPQGVKLTLRNNTFVDTNGNEIDILSRIKVIGKGEVQVSIHRAKFTIDTYKVDSDGNVTFVSTTNY